MNQQQQFCLKWNNYQSNMNEVFLSMLVAENMVDVTLACEGENLKAHKMVLAACSPYFQSLFANNPCKHPIVILKDVKFVDLRSIIDFMYKGEVNVGQDQLSGLLKTAETLKVKGLAEVTEKQARGQAAPQLQQAIFGSVGSLSSIGHSSHNMSSILPPSSPAKKKRKRVNKKKDRGIEISESDDERLHKTLKTNSQRLSTQRLLAVKETPSLGDQIESSRILEQSMATAEVVGEENGQEGHSFVSALDDEAMSHALFDESATLGNQGADAMMISGPNTAGGQATIIVLDQGGNGVSLPNAISVGNSRMTTMTKGNLMTPMTTSLPGSMTPTQLASYPVTPSSSSTTTPTTPGGSSGIGSIQLTPGGSNTSSSTNNTNHSSPNKFECDICKLKFASNYNLKRHARTHDATRPRWQCNYCEKSFTRRDSLPKHINFVHKDQASIKEEDVSLEANNSASGHQESQGDPHPCNT